MPTRPCTIPEALWARLSALDARCDFLLERRSVKFEGVGQGGKNYTREWRVTIAAREPGERAPVACVAPSLTAALEGAVRMGEMHGWHAPRSPGVASA